MNYTPRFRFVFHMANLDSLNYCIQHLRRQLLEASIFADFGVHFYDIVDHIRIVGINFFTANTT